MLAISATVLFFWGIMTGCSKDESTHFTLGVNATYKDSGGNYQIGASPSVKFNITEHNNMGHICVNYWDSKSEVYNLGNGFSSKFNN